jgi:hypothetical protein
MRCRPTLKSGDLCFGPVKRFSAKVDNPRVEDDDNQVSNQDPALTLVRQRLSEVRCGGTCHRLSCVGCALADTDC